MDDELPTAISGTRRALKELVDGTIRVQIDIDPRFKADFHRLFPNIDTPVALAPLNLNFERLPRAEEPAKGGELAKLAGIWCKDEEFQEWLWVHGGIRCDEEKAANWIRTTCGVQSRAEIDNDKVARGFFLERVRQPFREWLKHHE